MTVQNYAKSKEALINELADLRRRIRAVEQELAEPRPACMPEPAIGRFIPEISFLEVFTFSPSAMVITRYSDGQYIYVNNSFLHVFGYELQDIIGHTALDLGIWLESEERVRFLQALLRDGKVRGFQANLRGKTGDIIIGKFFAQSIVLNGELYIIGEMLDITREIRAQEELQKSRQQFIDILQSINDGFFALDNNWRFTYINQEATRFFGFPDAKKLIGEQVWPALITEEPLYSQCHRAKSENSTVRFETFSLHAGRWLEVHIYPSADGLSVCFRDIQERKSAEEKMRTLQERFFTVFEKSPCMMSIRRASDRRYVEVNQRWLQATGYSRTEVIGRTAAEFHLNVHDRKCWERTQHALEQGKDQREILFRTKSGQIRVGLATTYVIEVDGEECFLNTSLDITETRQMEREMARLDRLGLVGEMAASIGHEIRNPMTTVRGYLQVLQNKAPLAEFAEHFSIMIEELDRANAIISDFLSLAKNKSVTLEPASITEIVNHLIPLIKADALLSGKPVHLETESVPLVLADEKEIRQLILNLVRNAIEATSAGAPIYLKSRCDGKTVILEVTDHGSGIPEELLDKLGTPFVTTKEHGLGLGLAVCYSIAGRHRASIHVHTGTGGTTFEVRFPAYKAPRNSKKRGTEEIQRN